MSEQGIKGLVVTFDSFDTAVVGEMEDNISGILNSPWEGYHDYKESLKDVDSFLRVIDWYTRSDEFAEYLDSIQEQYDNLKNLAYPPVKLSDGGANLELELSDKMKDILIGLGLNKLLEDHLDTIDAEDNPEVPGWEYYHDG